MSLMKRLLGQKKKKPTKADKTKQVNTAIHKLREHTTLLNKRKTHSEKQIANYNKAAQQCLKKKNRKGALAKIKLRKQVEKRVETLENQIFNLEVQIMALDETLMNTNMIDAMNVARNALKVENPDAMIEKAEEIQEDIQEQMDIQQELNGIMGQSLIDYDEDELEAELAELDDELMDDGLIYGNMYKSNPKKEEKEDEVESEEESDEEDEIAQIKKLEMEMNLTANDRVIDVAIVQNSVPKRLVMAC